MTGSAEGVIDLYSRRAAEWDADRSRALIEKPWLDRFLAHVPPGGSVLDLGCGSGEPIARYLIEQGFPFVSHGRTEFTTPRSLAWRAKRIGL